ncbi:GPI-anchored surface protein, putative, partial [Bodo saltans]
MLRLSCVAIVFTIIAITMRASANSLPSYNDEEMKLFPDEDDDGPNGSVERRQTLVEARMQQSNIHHLQELYENSVRNHQILPQEYFSSLYAQGGRQRERTAQDVFDAAIFRSRAKRKFGELLASQTTDTTCPLPDKCSPNGLCMQNFGCSCYQNTINGFWRGTTCDECAFGYAGSSCTVECPGGSCNPCNSNGQCNQGSTGDGVCTCYTDASRGFWGLADCSECADNYYGAECKNGCSGVDSGVICSGQGYCLDGIAGSGACVCNLGYDNSTDCSTCDGAHYGDTCQLQCDGYVTATNLPCSGHGTCSSGVDGNGVCSCNSGWAGLWCSTQCPGTDGDCNGHGVCHSGLLGNGTCTCTGNFAAPNCSVCITDYTGTSCNVSCAGKRTVSTDEVCTGRGVCTTTDQVNAVCECAAGYVGGNCQDACSGNPPCSGHGTCVYVSGIPTCSTCSTGWGGTLCQQCTDAYANSTDCATACPVGQSDPNSPGYGKPCNLNGVCIAGVCYCSSFSCGTRCDTFDGCVAQPYRNNNGLCYSSESCGCYFGYVGAFCNLTCSAGLDGLTCSGVARGVCTLSGSTSAVCSCRSGFAGAACQLSCPQFDGKVCSGNGNCNSVTGVCQCNAQWAGLYCNVPCLCNTAHGSCTSACDNYQSTDVCTSCQCNGNFTDMCFTCKNGTQGVTCQGVCDKGNTYATICNCTAYSGTASCSVTCPFAFNSTLNASVVCSGRGSCSDGRLGDGLCHCYSGFYGLACETQCSAANCSAFLGNGQCNSVTGMCECADDLEGHWQTGTSSLCDSCVDGYWGPACTEACSCNDHGTCDQNTGECSCYASATQGFYSGTLCDSCSVGYLGATCTTESVIVSQLSRNIYFLNGTAVSGSIFQSPPGASTALSPVTPVLLVDDLVQLRHVIVGGFPTVLVDATNMTTADASLAVLNISSDFPQVFGPCGEAAVSWKHSTRYFSLLQPISAAAPADCVPPLVVFMTS